MPTRRRRNLSRRKRGGNGSPVLYGDKMTMGKSVGYNGEFYGKIVVKETGESVDQDDFEYDENGELSNDWDFIYDTMDGHFDKYLLDTFTQAELRTINENSDYMFYHGFGGDEGDGIFNFFSPKKIPLPPPMEFTAPGTGETYVMSFALH